MTVRYKKTYREMETSHADMTDFRRPPYAVNRMIRAQGEQIRRMSAEEYLKNKMGSDADGHNKRAATGISE